MADRHSLGTRCVHAGRAEDAYGAPRTPIYNTTTFAFSSTEALTAAAETADTEPVYTRYGGNPSLLAVERQIADLENGEQGLLFSAGMAAISAVCLAHGNRGVVCIGNAYGGTLGLIANRLAELGWRGTTLDCQAWEALDAELAAGCGLVILETPTNPDLTVQDIQAIAERVHRGGGLLAIDNTFATPVNQTPLRLGADLVMHSATKFLGGHSDLTAGAVVANGDLLGPVLDWRATLGQAPAPETAALLGRSLQTLAVRMERHNANAQRVAEAMAGDSRVRGVAYPGLPGTDNHRVAVRQMAGFGGMVTLALDADGRSTTAVADQLRLFLNAPSLGGVESLVTQPGRTSHADLTAAEREARGIGDNLLRLSVGIEDAEDLITDLKDALSAGIGPA
jgi:cystathionine beta-lyase/cystathionine gamma-synthase